MNSKNIITIKNIDLASHAIRKMPTLSEICLYNVLYAAFTKQPARDTDNLHG